MKDSKSKLIPGEDIRIVEEKIHPEVFNDFYNYLEGLENGSVDTSSQDRRYQLAILVKEGTIESYRKIEMMIKEGSLSKEDKDFAVVALNFCRFKFENDLLDIDVGMVSGGLGGSANKIRYYLAVAAPEVISNEQFGYIKKCFDIIASSKASVLEEAIHHGFYVSLIILGSFEYAIGDIIDAGLEECDFLQKDYYLTNVEIPTDDRIRDWLDGKLDNEKDELSCPGMI